MLALREEVNGLAIAIRADTTTQCRDFRSEVQQLENQRTKTVSNIPSVQNNISKNDNRVAEGEDLILIPEEPITKEVAERIKEKSKVFLEKTGPDLTDSPRMRVDGCTRITTKGMPKGKKYGTKLPRTQSNKDSTKNSVRLWQTRNPPRSLKGSLRGGEPFRRDLHLRHCTSRLM